MNAKRNSNVVLNQKLVFKIKYQKNKNKASSLSIYYQNGGSAILKNIPIILPEIYNENPSNISNVSFSIFKKEAFSKSNTEINDEKLDSLCNIYDDMCSEITENNSTKIIVLSDSILISFNKYFSGEKFSFVVSQENYEKIVKLLLRNKKEFDVEFTPSTFSLFSKRIERRDDFKTKTDLINLSMTLKKEIIEQYKRHEEIRKTEPEEKFKEEKLKKKKQYNIKNEDDDDTFWIMLSFLYPDMAIIFRPFSVLSWVMYANSHNLDTISQEILNNDISKIAGFEEVQSALLENKDIGYQVTLFKDENQNEVLGVINVDENNNCILSTMNGDKSCLSINSNGIIDISYLSDSKELMQVNLVQNDDGGFTGNWLANHMNENFKGGLNIAEDFSFKQTNVINDYVKLNNDSEIDSITPLIGAEVIDQIIQTETVKEDVFQDETVSMNSWDSNDPYSN